MMANTRLLLVEDDRALADLVTFHFERAGYGVTRTGDGEEALILVDEIKPDIILLDWMIEGISGIEVCRRLRRRSNSANTPIIILTARGEESDRIRGFETGADDYVTKPFSPRELVARVNAILRRARTTAAPAAPKAMNHGGLTIASDGRSVAFQDKPVSLTALEFDILKTLLARPGFVFTRELILDAAYAGNIHVADRTIDSHVRNIRAKMAVAGCESVIETVHGVGFRLGRCEASR